MLARASDRTKRIRATPQYAAAAAGTASSSRMSARTIGSWSSTATTAETR